MRRWSRHPYMHASAIVAGAVAIPVGRARAATPPALGKAGRIFLRRGLFVGAVLKDPAPSETQWRETDCNTATLDGSSVPPIYAQQWALADYSTGRLPNSDGLFTISFGNIGRYDKRVVERLAHSFTVTHARHPDVLVHTDQIAGEWSEDELRSYVRTAKPDLLTFRTTHFRVPEIYDAFAIYRKIALEGSEPIALGHYGVGCNSPKPSDAELALDCFAGWTMGARWINLFRWNGTNTARFARIARESRRLSPFLVRLASTDIRIVPGSGRRPRHVPTWDPFASPYIDSISGAE